MDAATEFVYVDLDVQEAPNRRARTGTNDPPPFANLRAANERLMSLPGEHLADIVEIELDAAQMDALLDGRWTF
jgi:hypothetical protein